MLKYQGCTHFRQRIICATLSGRPIKITNIRDEDEKPGLRDFEASFLRLIDKVTNGSKIEINTTGTALTYIPGIIMGGKSLTHECGQSRGISYFVEGLLCLGPFAKAAIDITLTGITNNDLDLTIDTLRTTTLPIIRKFGLEEGLSIKVLKRGAPPNGGGMVNFKCPIVPQLRAVQLVDEGKIRRIRGIAYATRVSPQFSNRVLDTAKGLLLEFTPDVYISSDHYRGTESGLSPGYGLTLVAETTTGCCLSAECMGSSSGIDSGESPEDLGKKTALALLEEILNGGCVDSHNQSLALLFMVLCPEDISKIRLGKITEYTMEYLRHLRDFFGVTFKIEPDQDSKTVIFTCLGIGFKNMARSTF
ncbi:RNA 3'-terminal phosphate cyclase family protein [Tieghemostelium lacteum]|uniref:RNA 3'-terminal phosphate cyclase family protein n=1 Tax=Tieghemostelium lacteum TaxID=361077 RepID=A0A151ZHI2_TIELA|nr:RNA 3'-terminal phosphate cyclase family protein [Tieghemostelium lacteum]|eukprot:KYQ93340.1 RNA 3'-terminal phosphate cyclase family protein [Tieghemostelium lacteum]